MIKIEEKLDRITDILFGVSTFPGYYKKYRKYAFPKTDFHLKEIQNCNSNILTRYNGEIEKEIFH